MSKKEIDDRIQVSRLAPREFREGKTQAIGVRSGDSLARQGAYSRLERGLLEDAGKQVFISLFLMADFFANRAQQVARAIGILAAARHESAHAVIERGFQKTNRFRGALLLEKKYGMQIGHLRIKRKSFFAKLQQFAGFVPALLVHEHHDQVAQNQ